ncbi:MAG: GTP-binding protein [Sphingobium sp.]
MSVRLVTGFLGAGKTTLLNTILRDPKGVRYAVIVNELGEIGIDGALIADAGVDTVELSNGCVCCSLRGDLVTALEQLADAARFDAILIETTGIAAPLPLARDFASDRTLAEGFRLDGIVTVVDARSLLDRLADTPETQEQILVADHFVLNRGDQALEAVPKILGRLSRLNPFADVHHGLDAAAAALFGPDHVRRAPERLLAHHDHDHAHDHGVHGHAHGDPWVSASLTLDVPLDAMALTRWLDGALADHAHPILRAKGIFHVAGEQRRIVMQSVGGALDGAPGSPWRDGEARTSKIVLIGRRLDIDSLRAGFTAAAAA